MSAIVAALITVAGTVISALIAARHRDVQPVPRNGGSWEAPGQGPYSVVSAEPGTRRMSRSVWFGAASLVAWVLPIVGIPVALAGIGFGLSDISAAARRAYARTGVYLAVIGLMAAVANSAIGAYLGAQAGLR
jgi:hypothetical protein